jgi:competence protein ComEA
LKLLEIRRFLLLLPISALFVATVLHFEVYFTPSTIQPIENKQVLSEMPAVLKGPVNLNRASAGDLVSVPGIGPRTAQKIVRERSKRGHFDSVDDLVRIRGLGPKTVLKLKPFLSVAEAVESKVQRR